MNEMAQIRLRRAHLLARAAAERRNVSARLALWEAPLAVADKSVAAARYLRRHPAIVVAAVALLVLLKPRRAIAWTRRALVAWRTWRWISDSLRQRASSS